ncbi:MAG: SDR family NAD(P)-dependent oxidoreductase [Anaerolineales bacterium]
MTSADPIVERPLNPHRTAIVVGASSGFGAALARELAGHGYDLGLFSRRLDRLQALAEEIESIGRRAFVYQHDVRQTEAIPALLQQAVRELGGLDLFIYNAGTMFPQDPDIYDADQDLEVLDVNLVGAVAWLAPVAERFVRVGGGQIVGVGSIAGERGRRALPAYAASKSGLHTYLEGLRNRVSRHAVTVTTLKPGQMQTEMLANAEKVRGPIAVDQAARLAWKAIESNKQVAFIPARWALVGLVIRHIPSFIFRRMKL